MGKTQAALLAKAPYLSKSRTFKAGFQVRWRWVGRFGPNRRGSMCGLNEGMLVEEGKTPPEPGGQLGLLLGRASRLPKTRRGAQVVRFQGKWLLERSHSQLGQSLVFEL